MSKRRRDGDGGGGGGAADLLSDEALDENPIGITEEDLPARVTIRPSASNARARLGGQWELKAAKAGRRKGDKTVIVWSSDARFGLTFTSKEIAESSEGRNAFAVELMDSGFAGAKVARVQPLAPVGAVAGGAAAAADPGSPRKRREGSGVRRRRRRRSERLKGSGADSGGEEKEKCADGRRNNGGNNTQTMVQRQARVGRGESQRAKRLAKRIARRERIQCLHAKLHDMLRALPDDKYAAAMDEIDNMADTRWPAQRKIIRRALAAHNKTAKLATMKGEWAGRRDILAAALDKCDARSLVVKINGDPKHRSHITSFTSDHALLQTLTMWHFYSHLLEHDHLALQTPFADAAAYAARAGRIEPRTLYRWRKDFEKNGSRFSESMAGKAIRNWVFDDKVLLKAAKAWLKKEVRHKPSADGTCSKGMFRIVDFQTYLNDTLLPAFQIPPWGFRTSATKDTVDEAETTNKYLRVSEGCALAWGHRLGLSFDPKRKGYYVDNHDRADVLAHRTVWLATEAALEKKQYLWAQLPEEQARQLEVKIINNALNGTACVDATEEQLRAEMVYTYTGNANGKPVMEISDDDGAVQATWVEIHVDLLPPEMRQVETAVVNGFKMGGRLSVRFKPGDRPVIKMGQDETIFKM